MKKFNSIILLLFSIIVVFPQMATANGTSYLQNSTFPTGHVLPMEEGIISIDSEKLLIEVEQDSIGGLFNTNNPNMQANIRVVYNMKNETEEEMVVPIAFPQPGESKNWNITLDGEAVQIKGTIDIKLSELIGTNRHEKWIHPRTGEEYYFGGYDLFKNIGTLESKTFDVTLLAGQNHILEIEYEATLGIDEKNSLHPVYRLDYLMHPASYWSDFKDLYIQIDVPTKSIVHSNLLLETEGNQTYIGEFQELPKENLVLFISPSSGMIVDLFNSRSAALLFIVSLLFVFTFVIWLIRKKIKSKYGKWLSLVFLGVFVLAGYDIFTHKILGYPLTILQFIFFIFYVLILLFIWLKGTKK